MRTFSTRPTHITNIIKVCRPYGFRETDIWNAKSLPKLSSGETKKDVISKDYLQALHVAFGSTYTEEDVANRLYTMTQNAPVIFPDQTAD